MGWDGRQTSRSALDVCRADFAGWSNQDNGTETKRLADAMAGSTYYAAMETVGPSGRQVWALVVLTEVKVERGVRWLYTKTMDETCGPNESRAPAAILRLLTPTNSEWAKQWRFRCFANLKKAFGQCPLELEAA